MSSTRARRDPQEETPGARSSPAANRRVPSPYPLPTHGGHTTPASRTPCSSTLPRPFLSLNALRFGRFPAASRRVIAFNLEWRALPSTVLRSAWTQMSRFIPLFRTQADAQPASWPDEDAAAGECCCCVMRVGVRRGVSHCGGACVSATASAATPAVDKSTAAMVVAGISLGAAPWCRMIHAGTLVAMALGRHAPIGRR
jgi:hypothetical protein